MQHHRLAVTAVSLAGSLRHALKAARELGVSGIEIDARSGLSPDEVSESGIRQIRKWLADAGLEVAAVAFPTRRGYGEAEALEGRIAATKSAMRFARAIGADVVTNHVGAIPGDPDDPRWKLLLDVLADLGAWGHHVGATLAAEAGRAAPADLRRLIEALPEGSLVCDIASGSLVVHHHDPAEAVALLGGHVAFVHATDAVAGSMPGQGRGVVLGTGQVDFPQFLGSLEERGYRGWIGLEAIDAVTARRELADAIGYLRSI